MKNLWIFYLSVALLFALPSCQYADGRLIEGDGQLVTDTIDLDRFENIKLSGMFNVTLTKGNNRQVIVETDENLQELVDIQVSDETLIISTRHKTILKPTRMKLTITYSDLKKVSIAGACKLNSTEPVESRDLMLDISGAAEIDLVVNTNVLSTNLSGAGKISLQGVADKHNADLSGASILQTSSLITRETRINLSGAGSAEVYASDLLEANLSGVGSIRYFGSPSEKIINRSGIGTIQSGN
ncbi:MAG TPA: head GIN domain-containing protein [Bacteroidales bacterium]|nr:head GIN domain-containing protein [Bacteroidales bacterium]